jgi:hypothetical protein
MSIALSKLRTIIASGETAKIDFKETLDLKDAHQKDEFAKDVSAIANTPGKGGLLVYGVANDGSVRGISPSSYKEEQMQQIITSRCDPPVKFSAHLLRDSSRFIGVVEIPYSIARPHQHRTHGNFYIRRGTTTDKMSTREIRNAIIRTVQIEKYQIGKYDNSSSGYRIRQIRKDIIDIFDEFDYKYSRENQQFFHPYGVGIKTIVSSEVENKYIRVRFHVQIYGDTVTYYDIERYRLFAYRVSDNFSVRKNVLPWQNIFLTASYEPISLNTIKKRPQSDFSILVKLDSSTIYYGFGDVDYKDREISKRLKRAGKWIFLPEFYLTRIRSAEDIRSRLALILEYINEKKEVFGIVRNMQSKP